MAEKVVKIPQPSKEEQRALSLKGTDWRLVWDRNKRVWRARKVGDVTNEDITYDDWRSGTKSYAAPTSGGGTVPKDVQQKVKDVEDPLARFVDKHLLRVITDPRNGDTYLEGFTYNEQTRKRGDAPVPFYMYLDSKGVIHLSEDYDSVKSKTITDLKATKNLNNLFDYLYNKKQISKKTYDAKDIQAVDFNGALVNAINLYSTNVIGTRQFDPTATKAPNFLDFLKSGQGLGGAGGTGGKANLPIRDINLQDRDVIEAIVRDVYGRTTDMAIDETFLKQETDRYMKQIKEGTVGTTKKIGGEIVRTQTPQFSEAQVQAELPGRIKEQRPWATNYKQSFDFLAFLDSLGAPVV